jgi:Family of unknown function (DUF5670)
MAQKAHGAGREDAFDGATLVHPQAAVGVRVMMNLIWILAVVFAGLWLLGLVTSYTLGGFIHVLLVLAVVSVLVRLIVGRKSHTLRHQ